jgi:Xaa-Pro aminopeptidase
MSTQIIKEKVEQAKQCLQEYDVDCWITFARESQINGDPMLEFLTPTGITWHSAFIINRDGSTHVIVGRYDVPTLNEMGVYDEVEGFVTGIKDPFINYMKKRNPSKIAVNYSKGSEICDGLTYGMFLTLQEMLAEIEMKDRLVSAERLVSAIRERKTPAELSNMKEAVRITEEIWAATYTWLKPGIKSIDVAGFMKAEAEKRNVGLAWEPSVCPAVFAGLSEGEAHCAPGEKPVTPGEILNMDFGVRYNNYVSDTQRTFYVLNEAETEAPEDVQHGFDTIVKAVQDAKESIQPGKEGWEVDAVARQVVIDGGFEEFPHALGHQLGIFAHDGTALLGPKWEKYAEKPCQTLEENMVFTIEPRCTIANRGIATIEEMIVITKDGAEWLTTPQKELLLIGDG